MKIVRAPDPPYDSRGEPNSATTEDVKGYIEWKTQLIRNFAGEEVISRGSVLLVYDGTIGHEDKIRISSVDYPIIALEPMKDFSNVGSKVYLA